MKVQIKSDGQLVIASETTYEALALDSWYAKFFTNLKTRNISSEITNEPLLSIILNYDKGTTHD